MPRRPHLRPAFEPPPVLDATPEDESDRIAGAFERGRIEGAEEARLAAEIAFEKRIETVRRDLAERIDALTASSARRLDACREALIALALASASRMLRERIDAGDPVAARALEEALADFPELSGMLVRLNPADIEAVREHLSVAVAERGVELIEDPRVDRGGCVIETDDAGNVDAGIDAARSAVEDAARGTP